MLNERQETILQALRTKKIHLVREFNNRINASTATIHRDLKKLENEGYIDRFHGRIRLAEKIENEHNIDIRLSKNREQKIAIAAKAVDLIRDETSLFLDHSSTCYYVSDEIAARDYRHLLLVTNSLLIATNLQEKRNVDIVVAGGDLQPSWSATKGTHAIATISQFHFDQAFISCGMFSLARGARTNYSFISELLQVACQSALEINLLVDSSKFNKAGAFLIKPISDITRVITDDKLPSEQMASFQDMDTELII